MFHIKFFKDISKKDVSLAGGKGASLGEMTKAGIPVPPGFVVLASAFDRFLEETDLNAEIQARLKEVNINDTNSVDKASNVIRDAIHDHAMPQDLEKEILEAFDELAGAKDGKPPTAPLGKGGGRLASATPPEPPLGKRGMLVAVRSSATAEDSAVASWAGELETYLNTRKENVAEMVKKCWSSLFTPRAIFYRHEKNLIDHYVSVAVVVQEMVQSEISGIAFTVHPVTEDPNQMIIEAGFGLGEAIVSGQITPDSYIISKSDMSILDINIGTQTKMLIKSKQKRKLPPPRPSATPPRAGGGSDARDVANEWIKLDEKEGSRQKLNGKQIIELAKICDTIERHYGFPCDIEWAFACPEPGRREKFYITQSRPITTLIK